MDEARAALRWAPRRQDLFAAARFAWPFGKNKSRMEIEKLIAKDEFSLGNASW